MVKPILFLKGYSQKILGQCRGIAMEFVESEGSSVEIAKSPKHVSNEKTLVV